MAPLPDLWWRNEDLFRAEWEKHGSDAALMRAHGGHKDRYRRARKTFGIESPALVLGGNNTPRVNEPATLDTDDLLVLDAQQLGEIDDLLRERGLDPADWIIVRVVVNKWEGFFKRKDDTAERVPQRQLKVTLRPRNAVSLLMPATVTLPPISVSAAKVKQQRATRLVFVYGDDQRPNVDRAFEDCKLQWLARHQPDVIVDLGDGMDMPTVSGHKTNPATNWPVQACADDYATWLHRARSACPDAEMVILADNHVQRRLRDYQLERAAALYGVRPADIPGLEQDLEPLLSIRRLLRLDELGVRYIDPPGDTHYAESQYEIVPGRLVALHGYRTGANVGRKLLDDYGCSIVYGHVHGEDVHVTDWKRRGVGKRERLYALGVGCGANLHGGGGFAPGADWQNSALTISVYPDGGWTWEPVHFEDGVLRWRDEMFTARNAA